MTDSDGMLPGLAPVAPKHSEPGPVETGLRKQIAELRAQEILTDAHAAWEAHALATARDIDRSEGQGRPSGRAALRDSFTKILENMPAPEAVSTSELDRALEAIMDK